MSEKEKEVNNEQTENTEQFDAVEELNKLKANTVPKSEFDKLNSDYAKLFKAYASGERQEETKLEEPKDLNKLRDELFNNENLTNLEYAKKALELRQEVMKQGGIDPFVPQGKMISATPEDYACAEKVADVLGQCIEYAEGDSQLFTNELMRRTKDSMPFRR